MGCIAIQLLCPRHGQDERAGAWGAGLANAGRRRVLGAATRPGAHSRALQHGTGRVGRREGKRAGCSAGVRGARGTGAGRAAWACCWAVGCALCALSLFLTRFDSVLFLSQFLDIVREPGT